MQTQFFYGQYQNVFYDPAFNGIIDRDLAVGHADLARRHRVRHLAVQPLPPARALRRHRQLRGALRGPGPRGVLAGIPGAAVRPPAAQQRHDGAARPRLRAGDDGLPRVRPAGRQHRAAVLRGGAAASAASCRGRRSTLDARKYFRLGGSGLLALRARGFKSWGDNPGYYYFGGNSRDARLRVPRSSSARTPRHLNAELRIPLIHAMATPIGILGGIRGTLFANVGGASWDESAVQRSGRTTPSSSGRSSATRTTRQPRHRRCRSTAPRSWSTASAWSTRGPATASACRPSPSASRSTSTGAGARCFNKDWEDVHLRPGGRQRRRSARSKFTVWIGYDF